MLVMINIASTENKIYETLIKNEICHEDSITIFNKEKNYRELKESIRMLKSQRSDTETNNLIEEGKKG